MFAARIAGAIGSASLRKRHGHGHIRTQSRRPHHSNFRPNCTGHDAVAVDVMAPAVGDGPAVADAQTTGFGALKFV
jgi:hypothetical protein